MTLHDAHKKATAKLRTTYSHVTDYSNHIFCLTKT